MVFFETWVRFSDLKKPCEVCGKPDGCCISRDGSKILCSRIESTLKIGEPFAGGWVHAASGDYRNTRMPKKKSVKAPINWRTLNRFYTQKITKTQMQNLANEFNIHPASLFALEIGWDGESHTFPVRNVDEIIIGILRRFPDGTKCMVKGSSLGLFIPRDIQPPLFITEGASDLACVLDLGFRGIAKPSATAGNNMVKEFIAKNKIDTICIICDNDDAGVKGTITLVRLLVPLNIVVNVISPLDGIKDIREWIGVSGKAAVKSYLGACNG